MIIYECYLHVMCLHMTQECLFLLMKLVLTDETSSESMDIALEESQQGSQVASSRPAHFSYCCNVSSRNA